jgi:hypothetical protein
LVKVSQISTHHVFHKASRSTTDSSNAANPNKGI